MTEKQRRDAKRLCLAWIIAIAIVALHIAAVWLAAGTIAALIFTGPAALNARFWINLILVLLLKETRRFKPFGTLFSNTLWGFRANGSKRHLKAMQRVVKTVSKFYRIFCMIVLIAAFLMLLIYALHLNAE